MLHGMQSNPSWWPRDHGTVPFLGFKPPFMFTLWLLAGDHWHTLNRTTPEPPMCVTS